MSAQLMHLEPFVAELTHVLRHRAKRLLNLPSVRTAHTGAVAAIQRTDGALRLNVHLYVLAIDGVYLREDDGALVFFPLPAPTRMDVTEVARRTACRIERILRAHGRRMGPQMQDDESHAFLLDQPGLAACYAASEPGCSMGTGNPYADAGSMVAASGRAAEAREAPRQRGGALA
jgi:hypothetical protein